MGQLQVVDTNANQAQPKGGLMDWPVELFLKINFFVIVIKNRCDGCIFFLQNRCILILIPYKYKILLILLLL